MRIATACFILLAGSANAGLVSHSLSAEVLADFDGTVDTDNSTTDGATIGAFATGNNSFTDSDLTYAFDPTGSVLTGGALVVAEKTVSARPGGDHLGTNSLALTFTIDAVADFDLSGDWGFDGANPGVPSDSLIYVLTGPSGVVSTGSTTSNLGIASDSFSASGTLTPGLYTFSINASLTETINNQGTAQAGWQISQFALTHAPEPGSFSLVAMASCFALLRRRRRTNAA